MRRSSGNEAPVLQNLNISKNNKLISKILNNYRRAVLGVGILALIFIYRIIKSTAEDPMERVITPFPSPKLMDLPMVTYCSH